jgi:hypothetical protein
MPPAKQPVQSSARARTAFKEPAALKRFNRSLDAAQQALAELRKDTGRDVAQGARDRYEDLRTFVSSARRDSAKLTWALQRDDSRSWSGRSPSARARSNRGIVRGRAVGRT